MDLKYKKTKLTPVGKIEVPEKFFNRFQSGIEKMDLLFGGAVNPGILPGSSFAISARPGCGKSTLIMQWLNALSTVGYKAAVVSGEEAVEMIALNARRLKVTDLPVANMNYVEDIVKLMPDLDVLIIDSFQAIHAKETTWKEKKLSKRSEEEYKVNLLLNEAKKNDCVIGFVLHVTKSGNAKGGMVIFHSVDCIIEMYAEDDTTIRWISTEGELAKNRFGPPTKFSAALEPFGFDFTVDAVETLAEENKRMGGAPSSKGARRAEEINMLKAEGKAKGSLTLEQAGVLIGDMQRARFLMSDLHLMKVFIKSGRGANAVFKYNAESEPKAVEQIPATATPEQVPQQ